MTRTFDRVPFFDARSRDFPVRPLLSGRPARELAPMESVVWTAGPPVPLDQGSEGACTGFGLAHELGSEPEMVPDVTDEVALDLYRKARIHDRAMGNDFPAGASMLATAKAAVGTGYISGYRWAFSIEDTLDAIVECGPVLLGIWWYASMYETAEDGLIGIDWSRPVGGHCIMAHGFWAGHPRYGDLVMVRNSWGPDYGYYGVGYLRVDDLARLLADRGEACVPMRADDPAVPDSMEDA